MGEYEGRFEIIDRQAPLELKRPLMRAVVLSQIVHYPARVFAILLPTKAIKLFLTGYSSGIEQGLASSGYAGASHYFKGMRLAYAPVLLVLMVIGVWRLFGVTRIPFQLAILIIFLPAVTILTTVLFGETSPRYCYYISFAMCMTAGMLMMPTTFGDVPRFNTSVLLLAFFRTAGIYCALAIMALFATRVFFRDSLIIDVCRTATLASWSPAVPPPVTDVPIVLQHYLRHVSLPARTYSEGDTILQELRIETANHNGACRIATMIWPSNLPSFQYAVRFGQIIAFTAPLSNASPQCVVSQPTELPQHGSIPLVVEIVYHGHEPLRLERATNALDWGFVFVKRSNKEN